jgi:PhnB protein
MTSLNPHLIFDGQCEAAFRFYETALGGKITLMMSHGNSPMASEAAAEWRAKILHATFSVGDAVFSGSDARPEEYRAPQGFCVLLNLDDAAGADRIFAALAQDGAVQLPLQQTFWALRFGMLTDRFGIPWMINCGRSA